MKKAKPLIFESGIREVKFGGNVKIVKPVNLLLVFLSIISSTLIATCGRYFKK